MRSDNFIDGVRMSEKKPSAEEHRQFAIACSCMHVLLFKLQYLGNKKSNNEEYDRDGENYPDLKKINQYA